MIILISGNSCTGKTYMAQQLLEKYHMPYLSIDHLKMGLYRADMNCGFTPMDSTEHIGEHLWPILKGIIMTSIENKQNLIIEGCYILPHHLQDFKPPYSQHIMSVFLGFSTTYIRQNFQSNIVQHRNAIEARMYPEEELLPSIFMSMMYSVKSARHRMSLILKFERIMKKKSLMYMPT